MTPPKDRPQTRFAARIVYGQEGLDALDSDRCPSCKGDSPTRPDLDWELTGLCQSCQQRLFLRRYQVNAPEYPI